MIEHYKSEHNVDSAAYKTTAESEDIPHGFPTRGGGLCSSGEPILEDQLENDIKDVEGEIEEITNQADYDNADESICEEKFTRIVFVVLKRPQLAYKVINQTQSWRLWKTYAPSCFMENEDRWYWERAPEPSDIFYENLAVSTCARIFYSAFSYFMTIILMGLCLAIIGPIKTAQKSFIEESKKDGTLATYSGKAKTQLISGSATVFVVIVNYLL